MNDVLPFISKRPQLSNHDDIFISYYRYICISAGANPKIRTLNFEHPEVRTLKCPKPNIKHTQTPNSNRTSNFPNLPKKTELSFEYEYLFVNRFEIGRSLKDPFEINF